LLSFTIVLAAALQGMPVSAAQTPPATTAVDKRKVCRSNVPTGSHFAKRICHTKADWRAVDAENELIGRATNASRSGMQTEPFLHKASGN
jgi:hypothetical protein